MPLFDYKCETCGYSATEFVWITAKDELVCPDCGCQMIRLFTPTAGPLLGREKPMPFKFDPGEPNADKSIWKTVISDAEKGKLKKGELEWWKKEINRTSPNMIL